MTLLSVLKQKPFLSFNEYYILPERVQPINANDTKQHLVTACEHNIRACDFNLFGALIISANNYI
jgi:hypothetical protein